MSDEFIRLIPKKYSLKQRFKRTDTQEILFRHGHIAITNYKKGDNYEFEKSISVWDKISFKYRFIGGYYIKDLKELRINRSFDLNRLRRFFPDTPMRVDNDAYPCDHPDIELFAEPKSDFQRVAMTFMASEGEYSNNRRYTQQMITAPTGSGKAIPNDALIPTPKGLRKAKSIKVGDKVFNVDGQPVKVLGVYPQEGKQETYELTFKDGRTARCNLEHLWEVTTKDKVTVMPLSEILKDYQTNWLAESGATYSRNKYSVPLPGPIEYAKQDVPVDPYVLGALIGNGGFTSPQLSISSGNPYVPKEITKRIGHPATFRRPDNYTYKFIDTTKAYKNGDSYYKYIQTKDFFKDLPELIGCKSHTKFIPDIYKYNSIKVRWLVLQGLFDTDGYIDSRKYQISYSTTSEQLKDDIVEIIRSLGYIAYVTRDKRDEKYKYGKCFKIQVGCPDKDKPKFFRANEKSMKRALYGAKHYKTRRKDKLLKIVDIKKIKPTKQRCFLVDDPRHLFITENFVVTHNTYLGIASTAFLSSRAVIIVPFSKLLKQWKDDFLSFTSLTEDEILIVQGSKECYKIMNGEYPDVKVFIFMVDTIQSFVDKYGNMAAIDMFAETNAYIKIVDEVHRDIKALSMIEALCNFRMNYYMSASPGRTEEREDWIFHTLFRNIPKFGANFETQDEKHINILIKKYHFTPSSQQIGRIINKRTGMNTLSYETELLHAEEPYKESFEQSLITMLKWTKGLLAKDHRLLILAKTVGMLEYIQTIVEKVFPGETSLYHGKMKPKEKEEALKSTVIIATSGSLGTGANVKNLQHCYNCGTYSGKIEAIQTCGRLRALPNKSLSSVYVEFVNYGWKKTVKQYEKRKKHLLSRSKTGKIIVID